MNANDVLESYVTDVALRLPRRQRNDVAFELRALLAEELQAKADAAGRAPDASMALDLARAFGRPEDVAARYRLPLTIIDPADGQAFLQATWVGLAIIWGLGLVAHLRDGTELLLALGGWWVTVVIPSLWWPGVLVMSFGLAAWSRRRRPPDSDWTPRAAKRAPANQALMVLAVAGILLGLVVLLEPRRVLDVFFGGRAAPAAYDSLTYTDAFRHGQAPWLFVLLLFHVPMMITVIVSDRWAAMMQRSSDWVGLVTCAVIARVILGGPIFVGQESDRMAKSIMTLLLAYSLLHIGITLYRRVRPAPDVRS